MKPKRYSAEQTVYARHQAACGALLDTVPMTARRSVGLLWGLAVCEPAMATMYDRPTLDLER